MSSTDNNDRPQTWGSKRRGKAVKYTYTTISEIYDVGFTHSSVCNIYGIISDFKEPSKSKGTDFYALVFVIDDTNQEPLRIRLFSRDMAFFPKVDNGDIIRLHRLKVYKSQSTNLISTKGWSWVLWRYEDRDNVLLPELSGSDSYTLLSSDHDRVNRLKAWCKDRSNSMSGIFFNTFRISEIEHKTHFTLLCQVIDFKEVNDKHIIVKVWDGSQPTQKFYIFDEFNNQAENAMNVDDEFVVQISIYEDHVKKWQQLNITPGTYVEFCNLHAWCNSFHMENKDQPTVSELSLHQGKAYGRGVELATKSDELDKVERDISDALAYMEIIRMSQPLDNSIDSSQEMEKNDGASNIDNKNSTVPDKESNKVSQSFALTHSQALSSQPSDNQDSDELRCLQQSITVVTGDGMPLKLTDLQNVIKRKVPVHSEKYFRVRVQIQECITNEDDYVGHYSPVTGMFFSTSNTGEPLESSDEVRRFVKAWRQVRNIDSSTATSSSDNIDSQKCSQWDLPDGTQNISSYNCEKDGSKWKSVETENYVVRKRKKDGKRFTILYLLKPDDFSPEALKKWSKKHDRVIRSVPLSMLVSEHPAVGIQDDVFYYSCPGYAVEPRLSDLKEEAEKFNEDRIGIAMNSPTLVPQFRFIFNIVDKSSVLENVVLSGENATEFLRQTTPQSYLNNDDVAASVKECIRKIDSDSHIIECIIEKKSRRRADGSVTPAYLYEICNTTLVS